MHNPPNQAGYFFIVQNRLSPDEISILLGTFSITQKIP